MKKNVILLMLLLSTIFIPPLISAQETTPENVMVDETTISTESAAPKPVQESDDYVLPYPGLLPDSPFYFLKAARDGVIGLLITNAAKKAEFNILQADKRLAAANMLIHKDKQKHELAITTLSKGENYMEQAILKTEEARSEGLETNEVEKTLQKAVKKHKQVIAALYASAVKDEKKSIETVMKRVEKYEKKVNELVSKKKAK